MLHAQLQPHAAIPSVATQCTQAPTERHSSLVETVLTGSRVALPGLIEIFMGPHWGHGTINQG